MVVMSLPSARRRLGRIRCVQETIASLIEGRPLPESLCYVPLELEYYSPGKNILKLHASHCTSSQIVKELMCTAESRLIVKGEELCNKHGKWLQIKKFKQSSNSGFEDVDVEAWLLLFSNRSSVEETPPALPVTKDMQISEHLKDALCSWEDVVDDNFSLKIQQRCFRVAPADKSAVMVLQGVAGAWSLEHDEALVQLMAQHIPRDNDALGAIKSYVELVDVSSYCDEDGPLNLTDGDPDTYWESDGSQGQHWIQLRMKKGTVIKKLCITLDGSDDNYLPSRLVVQGGEQENLKILNTVHINWTITGTQDVALLENMTEHYPVIMIRIKECFAGGIDTRIRGIKLVSTEERSLGFDRDFFTSKNLVRFPVLESFSPDALYRRAIALQRFVTTLDSVLQYMVPAWQHTVGSYTCLQVPYAHASCSSNIQPPCLVLRRILKIKVAKETVYNVLGSLACSFQKVRQLLLLSKRRLNLIEVFLRDTAAE